MSGSSFRLLVRSFTATSFSRPDCTARWTDPAPPSGSFTAYLPPRIRPTTALVGRGATVALTGSRVEPGGVPDGAETTAGGGVEGAVAGATDCAAGRSDAMLRRFDDAGVGSTLGGTMGSGESANGSGTCTLPGASAALSS